MTLLTNVISTMKMKEFARCDQWAQGWTQRVESVANAIQLGEYEIAVNKANKCLRDLINEIGRDKCIDHPDGCPIHQIDHVDEIPLVLHHIRTRVNIQMHNAMTWN